MRCDTFEAEARLDIERRVLAWRYWTDLPAGTRISLDISRRYLAYDGRETLWTLHDEALLATAGARGDFNGGSGEISIDDGDLAARSDFESGLDHFSAGMKGLPGPAIHVSFCVGARQQIKAFGRDNVNLAGGMVELSGTTHIVLAERIVDCAMASVASPISEEES